MARRHKHFGVAHARLAWPPLWQPNCRFSSSATPARSSDLDVCEWSHVNGVAGCLTKRFISYSGTRRQLMPRSR